MIRSLSGKYPGGAERNTLKTPVIALAQVTDKNCQYYVEQERLLGKAVIKFERVLLRNMKGRGWLVGVWTLVEEIVTYGDIHSSKLKSD